MPFKIRKVRGKKCYTVKKTKGRNKKTFSKCTTMKKAARQIRLLNYIEH